MSYHLHIKKLSNNTQQEESISVEDWLGIIKSDNDVSYIVDEGSSVSVVFNTEQDRSESIEWSQGTIDAERPSDTLARKMVLLANKLDARVVTDKGLCYF
ncbi:MAG: hypothetical protein KTR16_04650 [Acidiferrobacterales bacterium]|nr:hypothetical protein [Acidiferrobacterales bacterium]